MVNLAKRAKVLALALVLVLLAACSGSLPDKGNLATEDRSEAGDSAASLDDPNAAPGPEVSAGAPEPGAAGAPAPIAGQPGGGGAASATSEVATTGSGTSSAGGTGSTAQPIRDANLYTGADNTKGITAKEIVLCAHSALIFATALNIRPEDLNVYWTELNSKGGIFGRKVNMTFEDDAYSPAQAVTAAETCKSRNPFFLLGGIGFDQIPAVRTWAESNKML